MVKYECIITYEIMLDKECKMCWVGVYSDYIKYYDDFNDLHCIIGLYGKDIIIKK